MPANSDQTNLEGMDGFSKDLIQATRQKKFNKTAGYNSVVVLLLLHEERLDDHIMADYFEIDRLQSIFKGLYHFKTESFLIPKIDPENELIQYLIDIILPKLLEPLSLLIIYYSGRFFISNDGNFCLT